MQYDLGLSGLGLLVLMSLIFGVVAQFVGRSTTPWLWLIAAAGYFVGGLIASEVIWAGADVQPIIDGLSFDEVLLGGLIGGLIADIAARFATHSSPFHGKTPSAGGTPLPH
jgi:hypothetical protein